MPPDFINIIYCDKAHSDHMTERLEGFLLSAGTVMIDRVTRHLRQIGCDEITGSPGRQTIGSVLRRFEDLDYAK